MAEDADVVWTTITTDSARIELTKNELTISMTEEGMDKIDEKGKKIAEWFIDALLPHTVVIKDIKKVKREAKKIVIVSKGFLKRCTIGMPEPELGQLEAELNRLIK